jgi:hypothetical protein
MRAFFATRIARLGNARKGRDIGASAIELAIITAILVGLAATVLVIIYNIVTSRASQINSNNGRIP